MKCIKLAQEKWFNSSGDDGDGDGDANIKNHSSNDSDIHFNVIALGGLGGRVDQSFHSLHHLYISQQEGKKRPRRPETKQQESLINSNDNTSILKSNESKTIEEEEEEEKIDLRYYKHRSTIRHSLVLLSITPTHANITILLPPSCDSNHQKQRRRVISVIDTPMSVLGPAIGLIPLSGKTHLTTTGLVYDVNNWATEFGGNVSTSNYLEKNIITVESRELPIVFTVEIKLDPNSLEKKNKKKKRKN